MEEGLKCPPKHTIEWKVLLHNLDNNEQDATESWRRNNEIVPTGTKLLSEIGWYKEARELRKKSVEELAEFIVSHTKESFSQKKISNSYWMKEFGDLGRATQKINKVNLQVRKELFQLHPIAGKYHKKSGNQMRILKTTDGRSIFKQVNYTLKPVDTLMSDRAVQMFSKAQKVGWTLDKTLNELGGFANYKQLFKQDQLNDKVSDNTREQLITELASNYSFVVEINTASTEQNRSYTTESISKEDFEKDALLEVVQSDQIDDEIVEEIYKSKNEELVLYTKTVNYETDEVISYSKTTYKDRSNIPTQYYSNLTVPGGTNYTENEISTPLITPSIKGHAQFATDKGIGWFRSDEQVNNAKLTLDYTNKDRFATEEDGPLAAPNKIYIGDKTKTRRILEVQSDLFQKWRNNFEFEGNKYTVKKDDKNVWHYYKNSSEINANEYTKIWDTFLETYLDNADAFTKLLQKDNNWVTFFVKSIIQDSAKQTVTEVQESDVEAKVKELEKEGLLEIDCKGKLKAEKGLQTNFTKGGKWKLVKDLKGYPTHKEGGVDLTIGKNGVSIKNGNSEFTAKHGLVIPKN